MYNFVFHDTEIDRLMLIMTVISLNCRAGSLDGSHVLFGPLKGKIADVNPALERAVHIRNGQHHERNQQSDREDLEDVQPPV
jgi:hypothetical protein